MRTAIAMLILMATAHGQTSPYWTPILPCGDIPEDRYGSSYGFGFEQEKPVVTKRYVYPVTDPLLFAGDTILSIRGKEVTSSTHAQALLDDSKSPKMTMKVRRSYADGTSREFNVNVERSVYTRMKTAAGEDRGRITFPLQSLDLEAFGLFACHTEYVGDVTDPETGSIEPAFRLQPDVKSPKGLKSIAARLGVFMLRDRRVGDTTKLVIANFPREQWKSGTLTEVQPCCVMVSPSFDAELNGRSQSVRVLTAFNPMEASEPIEAKRAQ